MSEFPKGGRAVWFEGGVGIEFDRVLTDDESRVVSNALSKRYGLCVCLPPGVGTENVIVAWACECPVHGSAAIDRARAHKAIP